VSTDTATDELIGHWITRNPHKSDPAEAAVLPRRTSVWVVIGQLQLDYGKAESVAGAYDLPVEAVEAALAYYQRHQAAIDKRIAANRAFFAA
jgi:uncharacterized protein (DUF433 family)